MAIEPLAPIGAGGFFYFGKLMSTNYKRYRHLAERVFDTPLLISPDKLRTIAEFILPRIQLETDSTEITRSRQREGLSIIDGVAVIDVFGTLVQRHSGMNALSGLTSYEQLNSELRQAARDPAVDGILLLVDSPGGEAAGVFDFADRLRTIDKPVFALAEDLAASAAYLIGSAADKFFVTQNATVGSIGVVMAHLDQSEFNERMGVKVTEIHAGARKIDTSPHKPLTKEGRQSLQNLVNATYDLFVGAVARNRGMSVDAVRDTEAGLFVGSAALEAGLADGVARSDDMIGLIKKELTMSENTEAMQEEMAKGIATHLKEFLGLSKKDEITTEVQPEDVVRLEAELEDARLEAETLKAVIAEREEAERIKAAKARVEKLVGLGVTEDDLEAIAALPDETFAKLSAASVQLATGEFFKELGRSGEGEPLSAEQELQRKADEIQEKNPEFTAEQAYTQAMRENPELYEKHLGEAAEQED